jgi:hypothetical protein
MRGLPLRSAGGAGGAVGISKYNTASLNFSQSWQKLFSLVFALAFLRGQMA